MFKVKTFPVVKKEKETVKQQGNNRDMDLTTQEKQ